MSARSGKCRTCDRPYALTKNGLIHRHISRKKLAGTPRPICVGSGKPPADDASSSGATT